MKAITVNGEVRKVRPMTADDMCSGSVVRHRVGRSTYRLLCLDGDEAVLRNLRYPDKFMTWPASDLTRDFVFVI